MWKLHFQGFKWLIKLFLGFDNYSLPSLVWKHMVMVMIDMHIILMGCGLMIPISQLGPYYGYFKIWKKLQFVNEKSFWSTLHKIWFALQNTNNSLLALVSLVWNFDNYICNWNKNLDLLFLTFKIIIYCVAPWHTPNSLIDSIVSPKIKTMEGYWIGICFLACNTLGVKGHAEVPGWGLRQMTKKSIIHTNLHKPNNKFVNA